MLTDGAMIGRDDSREVGIFGEAVSAVYRRGAQSKECVDVKRDAKWIERGQSGLRLTRRKGGSQLNCTGWCSLC